VDEQAVAGACRQAIPHEVAEQLGYYVGPSRPAQPRVLLRRQGVGIRAYAHAGDTRKNADGEHAKLRRINVIPEAAAEVEHLFVRTALPD
jgi:hypothetical protein